MSHNLQVRGYLVENATVHEVNSERDALNFTIASTRRWGTREQPQEKTEYFDCVVYRPRGMFAALMSKGRMVKGTEVRVNRSYMETSKNEKDGKTYYNTQFVVDGWGDKNNPALEIISTKAERDFIKRAVDEGSLVQAAPQQAPTNQQGGQQADAQQGGQQNAPSTPQTNQATPQTPPMNQDWDDDIPF
ncbi:single-stranded DNA-binding protein [Vibrio owensii]|uniref:single-stranded DNA-binding protein n=1 Tax=Vibrio owensii TaxID=696485 RepID=UPI003CC67ED8